MQYQCYQTKSSLITLFLLALLTVFSRPAMGQFNEDLYVYGYFQGQYRNSWDNFDGQSTVVRSFSLQQLNLLFRKRLNKSFSGFVDIESLNTYSSMDGWGSIRFSEAWVQYRLNRKFSVKFGLHVPTFNNLNDIKNRTPLLPYIFRPLAYESSFSGLLPLSTFAPQQAFVSVDGTLTFDHLKADYSFYSGNQEEFITSNPVPLSSIEASTDTSKTKLLGGRIGIRKGSFKAGVSATRDKANKQDLGMGEVPRFRFGADLSFSGDKIFIESELISVTHRLSSHQQNVLSDTARQNLFLTDGLDKIFWYALLGYRWRDSFSFYVSYNYLADKSVFALGDGVDVYIAGVAYKPVDSLVFKAQYFHVNIDYQEAILLHVDAKALMLGASLLF